MLEKRELRFEVPWGHIAAVGWGDSSEKKVLVVHGVMDNADSFKRLLNYLPETYYYVSIDLPGHGFSSHFPEGINLDFSNYVLTIDYILNKLKWDNCLFIGHSFGGQLGTMYSILFPGKIEKIIVIDALLCNSLDPPEVIPKLRMINDATLFSLNKNKINFYTKEEILNSLQNKRRFKLCKEAAEALFNRAVTKIDEKYKFNRDIRLKVDVSYNFNERQNIELLKNLNIPILLIIASNSVYTSVNKMHTVDYYKKNFYNYLRVITVEGNHDVHNNNPENIAPHVISFFNDSKSKL